MARPETHPIKKVIGFDREMVEAVDRWRATQRPVPNASEAIRQLVAIGLLAPSGKPRRSPAERAEELAAKALEKRLPADAPPAERSKRKRRLLKPNL
jgi:hypothetical protein